MAHNDAHLDGRYKKPYPHHDEREEAGVSERANQQLSQGQRSFYAGAHDGSTPVGEHKGNRVAGVPDASPTPLDTGGLAPFTVTSGRK